VKLEGIGRVFKRKNFTEISELISGGPAWRKKLEAGDLVMSSSRKWSAC
jgi:carboxyl-terminal processing protease